MGNQRAHGLRALVRGAPAASRRMTAPAKLLIVTADDFGISRGVNRGIVEAHRAGILTSTSLMVNRPAAEQAADVGRACPDLSIGLHLELDAAPPTHVDSHHDVHKNPRVLPDVLALARRLGVPLRGYSHVRHLSKFYGQWGGETHLQQISVDGLLRLLDTELGPGVTELTCHAGYVDEGLTSSYSVEREAELRTVCDPRVRPALVERSIRLVAFRDLPALMAASPVSEGAAGSP